MAGTREGGTLQRERFRASLHDAVDGVDIVALQSAPSPALELRGSRAPAPAPAPPVALVPVAIADRIDAEDLLAEITALRIDLEQGRRRDLLIVLGAIAAALLVLALLIRA